MKNFLMMIVALAMTTLFVQANEEMVVEVKDAAVQAVQQAADDAPAVEDEKNTTKEDAEQEKAEDQK
jgi:hypothetical protein